MLYIIIIAYTYFTDNSASTLDGNNTFSGSGGSGMPTEAGDIHT